MEIIGIVSDTLIAGRLEICAEEFRRAVFDRFWGTTEARIVCKGRGFPPEGTDYYRLNAYCYI